MFVPLKYVFCASGSVTMSCAVFSHPLPPPKRSPCRCPLWDNVQEVLCDKSGEEVLLAEMWTLLVGWEYSNIMARRLKRERGFKLPFKNESLITYYPSNTCSCRKIGNYRLGQRSKQIIYTFSVWREKITFSSFLYSTPLSLSLLPLFLQT